MKLKAIHMFLILLFRTIIMLLFRGVKYGGYGKLAQ